MNFLDDFVFLIGKIITPFLGKIIQEKELPIFFSKLTIFPDHSKCLEIGCGRGSAFKNIVDYFHPQKMIAIDIADEELQKAKKLCQKNSWQNIKITKADAAELPFSDQSFDIVFIFAVLHHIKDWKKTLKEASRVLKSGGYLFIREPLEKFFQVKGINPFYRWVDKPVSLFKEEELKEEIKRNDFQINFWDYRGFYRKFLKISIEGICQKNQ